MADHSRTRDHVVAGSDDDALLGVFFCADPRPRDVMWSWGSQSLLAGKTLFRYVADPLIAVSSSHPQPCTSVMHIQTRTFIYTENPSIYDSFGGDTVVKPPSETRTDFPRLNAENPTSGGVDSSQGRLKVIFVYNQLQ